MTKIAFDIFPPARRNACVVFASPHSGRDYSSDFLNQTVLDAFAIRSSEDAFVDQLFADAPEYGAPLLCARAPRAYLDLNRSPDELDPAVIEGLRAQGHNPRVASGLGVIPRVVANGRAIYRGKISMAEAQQRLDALWHPYHRQLQALLDEALQEHDQAILIDCHSMPHEAMDGMAYGGEKRPEIVLGDRFGAAAAPDIVDQVEAAFAAAGFAVTRNAPFAGAYVTQSYGRPSRHQHAIQIEIDRSIYMNERQIRPNAQFEDVRAALRQVIAEICTIGQARIPLAAE